VERLFGVLLPGVAALFVAVDFLFRRGFTGGRVSKRDEKIE
jgi:hypothetical protein